MESFRIMLNVVPFIVLLVFFLILRNVNCYSFRVFLMRRVSTVCVYNTATRG